MPKPWEVDWGNAPQTDPNVVAPDPARLAQQQAEERRRQEDQDIQRRGDQRDETRAGIAIQGAARDDRKEGREETDTRFKQAGSLRDDFTKSDPVAKYRTVINQYANSLDAGENTAGDQLLINSYAQMLNPTSTVMLGEYQATEQVDSKIQQIKNRLMKEFGWDGAGRISPAARQQLIGEMQGIVKSANQTYNQQRAYFGELAQRSGFDPFDVVGPHAGEPYLPKIEAYWKAHGGKPGGPDKDEAPPLPASSGANPPGGGIQVVGGPPGGDGSSPSDPTWTARKAAQFWGQDVYDQAGHPLPKAGGEAYDRNGNYLGMFGAVSEEDAASPLPSSLIAQGRSVISNAENGAAPDANSRKVVQDVNALADMDGDQVGSDGVTTMNRRGITAGLSDEAAGVGGAIAALLTGDNPVQGYYTNKAAQSLVEERARAENPSVAGGAELIGSFAGAGVPGALEARLPTVAEIAKGSAVYGGVAGFGEGQGVEDSLARAGTGAVIGGATGAGLAAGAGKLGQLIASKRAARAAERGPDMAVVEAGQRQDIPIRQPDAIPSVRGDMAGAEAKPYSGALIKRTLDQDSAAVEARLGQIGGDGTPQGDYGLGQQVQKTAENFIERTRRVKNATYKKAEDLSEGQRIDPQQAIAEVDRNIAELKGAGENTNSAAIGYLQGLREDLAKPGGFSITEFQALRSAAAKKIKGDNALTVSDADRRLGNVVGAFTADAEAQLPQAASATLREADRYYAERQGVISGVLQNLVGTRAKPLSPEASAQRITAMAQNKADFDKLSRFMKEAGPEERADFAATLAESLGKGRNGEFGLGSLATNIEKVPPNIRVLVFGDDGAKALADLQIIARAKSETSKGLNNSRTAAATLRNVGLRAVGSALLGATVSGGSTTGAIAAPIIAEGIAAIGQARTARLLLNPSFTKWLKMAPNSSDPQTVNRYVGKLAAMAGSRAAANDIDIFQDALMATLRNSPAPRAAAEGQQNEDIRREPPRR